jgi:hypothetical protein
VRDDSRSDDRRETTGRIRWRPLVPVLLLCAVAINQIRLVWDHDLDPWKGGGFGMFSTTAGGRVRHTHLFLETNGEEVEVMLSDALADIDQRARSLPSEAWLDRLARALAEESAAEYPDLSGIRVELWRVRLDPVDLSPSIDRMRNHTYAIQPDAGG